MTDAEFMRTLTKYVLGFGACLFLSVGSYLLAVGGLDVNRGVVAFLLLSLAAIQLYVQLVCFLHIGEGKKSPYSRTATFTLTISMALVIIVGSLWIMRNLDYRMGMSPEAMQEYMEAQNRKGF